MNLLLGKYPKLFPIIFNSRKILLTIEAFIKNTQILDNSFFLVSQKIDMQLWTKNLKHILNKHKIKN